MSAGPAVPSLPLKRTALHPFHSSRGAHLVPFAGWEMPLYYASVLAEHEAVRTSVGLFDVSHMGILTVRGGSAAALLSRRTTANVEKLESGQCRYTFLLEAGGAIVDDLLITRTDDGSSPDRSFLVVPNAAHAEEVYDLLRSHRHPDTTVEQHNGAVSILAVQGPRSRELLERLFPWALGGLGPYHAAWFPFDDPTGTDRSGRGGPGIPSSLGRGAWVSRTGYTGELGFEMFVRGNDAARIAERITEAGAVLCGLAARDTLRMEKGYLLSGQDFLRDRTPLEAGQERFVELDHEFVGRAALVAEQEKGVEPKFAGLSIETPGAIPRHGTVLLKDGARVGIITSGGQSFTLKHGIALAYLPSALAVPGTQLTAEIRGQPVPATVVKLPFVRAASSRG